MTHRDPEGPDAQKRQSRRRLLASLGLGIAGAYVAPTLFSLGQAQAQHGAGRSRPSYSRPSYSRPSYSRPSYSRPSGGYRRDRRDVYHRREDDRPGVRLVISVTPSRW
ncbi:hypothetical protein BDK63_003022 [Halomonas campaniensis]|uniref:Uncharacterized protein n=1 Tax=Halomonas campaniensis TaxID=213554 RepID=A0A7W5K540_9GAMM|nr:hypothetical protein [Halomonas campaniensis]MBB3332128.1 hypothetical protein [Halomonas campaniensis]